MSLKKVFHRKLTREQRAAASRAGSEVLCLASPGSGILQTIAWRAVLLAAGEGTAEGVCCLTFTERAARTLRRRVFLAAAEAGLPASLLQGMRVGTVHAYALEILRGLDPGRPPAALLDPWLFRMYLVSRHEALGVRAVKEEKVMSFFPAVDGLALAWKTANDELLDLDALPGRPGAVAESLLRIREELARDGLLDHSLAARRALEALGELEAREAGGGPGDAGEPSGPRPARGGVGGGRGDGPAGAGGAVRTGQDAPAVERADGGGRARGRGRPQRGDFPDPQDGEAAEDAHDAGRAGQPADAAERGQCLALRRALSEGFSLAGPQGGGAGAVPAAGGGGGARAGDAPPRAEGVPPLRHLLVEGFQDATIAQARLVTLLGSRAETIFCSGDDDRAIEPGRGIGARNTPPFWGRRAGSGLVSLGTNVRSSEEIAKTAAAFAEHTLPGRRHPKDVTAPRTDPPRDLRTFEFPDRKAEARWIASRIRDLLGTGYPDGRSERGLTPGDFAILLRSPDLKELDRTPRHAAFTRALAARGVPFRLNGGANPFDVPETRAVLGSLELLREPSLETAGVSGLFARAVRPAFRGAHAGRFERLMADSHRAVHRPAPGAAPFPLLRLFHNLLEVFRADRAAGRPGLLDRLGIISRMALDCERLGAGPDPDRFLNSLALLRHVSLGLGGRLAPEGGAPPDAVEVTAVQGLKGLSRPCVFVPDVEQLRFPVRKGGYTGLLPREALATALKRGAYRVTLDKEARLFYTALTLAERYLYVTAAERLPRARRPAFRSRFFTRVRNLADWDGPKDPGRLPAGIRPAPPSRRLDEAARPASFPEIMSYLACPRACELLLIRGFRPLPGGEAPPAPRRRGGGPPGGPGQASRDPAGGGGTGLRGRRGGAGDGAAAGLSRDPGPPSFYAPAAGAVIEGRVRPALASDGIPAPPPGLLVDLASEGSPAFPPETADPHGTGLSFRVQLFLASAGTGAGGLGGEGPAPGGPAGRRGPAPRGGGASRVPAALIHAFPVQGAPAAPVLEIPAGGDALAAAREALEWAVRGVLAGDFPMRPHPDKCAPCGFRSVCPARAEAFRARDTPPAIQTPAGPVAAGAFALFREGRG
ncbi:MAG: ATP-dependent helicase [Deltaproteobacteria bacterium]|jgi:DNA helicase-2/ATP-dependent DNA helicase PcrA|nr:ATP-dependent helicase [Deltaproteobacteria bacterium]